MSAKEMFEKLGYEYTKDDELIIYKRKINDFESNIYFYIKLKIFWKTNGMGNELAFTYKELQAINQQVRELGWLDE